jgi:UDP-N-acetylmuramoylalanine--D-glutamate ligase
VTAAASTREAEALRQAAPAAHRAWEGRAALVMGLGSFGGGAGAVRYLAALGARVLVTDQRPAERLQGALRELQGLDNVRFVLGAHRAADFEAAEVVVVNPAVRPADPLLKTARAAGAHLTSEIELFLEAVRSRVVAITGTQGKSSTTHATHALLARCGRRAHLGGNIGVSLLPALPGIEREDFVVLELSSYQLEALSGSAAAARAEAVAVVNILADHLERHGTIEAYAAAKQRILELLRPGGTAVLPGDDARFAEWRFAGRRIRFSAQREDVELRLHDGAFCWENVPLARVADLALPGNFQQVNALVALGLAHCLGLAPEELSRALPQVRGLEHRLQDLGLFSGRRVIDNAVSTTPDSTISALRALPHGTVLVLGGRLKSLPLEELASVARERVAHAVAFGEGGPNFAAALRAGGIPVDVVATVEEAVARALQRGVPGANVLFSPAGSSFDAYGNFEERAAAFRAAVRAHP